MDQVSDSRITIHCTCGVRFAVRQSAVGHRVKCPKCSAQYRVRPDGGHLIEETQPAVKPAIQEQTAPTHKITVRCDCGAKYRIPADQEFRKAKCPRCGVMFTAVGVPEQPVKRDPPAAAKKDAWLYDLANDESSAGAAEEMRQEQEGEQRDWPPPPPVPEYDDRVHQEEGPPPRQSLPPGDQTGMRCPSCRKRLATGAAICIDCGVNVITGKALSTTQDIDVDRAYSLAEQIIRPISFIAPFGLYPIAAEGSGISKPWVIRGIALATVIVSAWFFFQPVLPTGLGEHDDLMLWVGRPAQVQISNPFASGQLSQPIPLPRYEPKQLITHAFLHGSLGHLIGNMIFLLVVGSQVNALLGTIKTLIIYPLLAIGAGLIYMSASAHLPAHPMLGASGAIMGLCGITLVLMPINKIHMAIWWRWGFIGGFHLSLKLFALRGVWVILFYVAFDVFYMAIGMDTGTAHWAHLGGLFCGIGVGFILLLGRLVKCRGGDVLTVLLGPRAWTVIGRPKA